MSPQRTAALALAAWLMLGVACGTEPTQPDLRVDQVEITPPGGSVQVQHTLQLSAVARTAAGDVLHGRTITWSSSTETFATVSQTGIVTGIAAGTVTISAASENRSAAVQVEVTSTTPPPPPPPPPGNPVPVIESVSPSLVVAGTDGATITVRGANFIAGSLVLWGGATRLTEVVSATELRFDVSGDDLAFAGTKPIRVHNPAPGGGNSNAVDFEIEIKGPKLRLDLERVELRIGDTARVRATVYDEYGRPVPGTGDPSTRVQWIRLDYGVTFDYYDTIRDSVRLRAQALGTFRLMARTPDGRSDTVFVVAHAIEERIVSMDVGTFPSCGLDATGRVYCWGSFYPYHGTYAPEPLPFDQRFQLITTGGSHACGLDAAGAAYCWGHNVEGRLGNGGILNSATPVPVKGGHAFVTLVAGSWHTCGLTAGGKVWCWGTNFYGQLGDDSQISRNVPVAVVGDFTFSSIALGPYHTCGLTADGSLYCWGSNSYGQAGLNRGACVDETYGGEEPCNRTPAVVETDIRFEAVAAGGFHTCALTSAGEAYCWGYGLLGQLGDGNETSSETPVAVAGGRQFRSLGAGFFHTCALTNAGNAWCWGENDLGYTGVEPATSDVCTDGRWGYRCNPAPVAVSGGLTFAAGALTVGGYHTCGMTTAGLGYCWGENGDGQLGFGTNQPRSTWRPQQIWDGSSR